MKPVGLLLVLLAPVAARAQEAPVDQVNWRYDEDWSAVAGKDPATLPGWTAAKYIALDPDGDIWLSTGLEARVRHEGYRDTAASDGGTTWVRVMPHADLHAGPFRAFVQGIAGYALAPSTNQGPADRTGIDLLQGFADLRLPIGDVIVTLRGGRELVALGSERLISARYGPNIPQPFDGYRGIVSRGGASVSVFDLDAVAIGPGNFDDRTSHARRVAGLYATAPLSHGVAVDTYWLSYRNDAARYNQGAGSERRNTIGARLFGKSGRWSWNWEAIVQSGRLGGSRISAWSIATETAYSIDNLPLRPRITLRANVASGDRDPSDRRLETFNALFPKGKYFGELSPVGPQNIVNLHGRVDLALGHALTAGVSAEGYWRHRRGDGVYTLQGKLLRPGDGSGARHIGNQAEEILGWSPSPIWSFTFSMSGFRYGEFLRSPMPRRLLTQIGFEARLRL